MQFSDHPDNLTLESWEILFFGDPVDKRGENSIAYLSTKVKETIRFKYIPKDFKVIFGNEEIDKDDLELTMKRLVGAKIVIDSTTLNFAELLILTQSIINLKFQNVSVMYVEPGNYNRKSKNPEILHKRDFELSESIIGYEAIPGHGLLVSSDISQKVVFLCGFEAERIDRALEDSPIKSSNCSCIFGVPAFIPGWEMDSFDNNIAVIKEKNISGGLSFCGATNPLAVLQKLEDIYKGLESDEQMFVVPLATKPMNLGACLFVLFKPKDRVAVLYDHPNEMKGKAVESADWHLFNIQIN